MDEYDTVSVDEAKKHLLDMIDNFFLESEQKEWTMPDLLEKASEYIALAADNWHDMAPDERVQCLGR